MAFLDEARAILDAALPEIRERTEGYIPRILVKEDIDRQEIVSLRSLRQLGMSDPENRLLDGTQITTFSRPVIIGDAGSGKSYILQHVFLETAQAFLHSSTLLCLVFWTTSARIH